MPNRRVTPAGPGSHADTGDRRSTLRHISSDPLRLLSVIVLSGLAYLLYLIFGVGFHASDCARPRANENAAIASLRSIGKAQEEFRGAARRDRDGDGVGEYGTRLELTKEEGNTRALLASSFAKSIHFPDGTSAAPRSAYGFLVFLPTAQGGGEAEEDASIDPDGAESKWCAYAWPLERKKGRRAFFFDVDGRAWRTDGDVSPYAGAELPRFDAAFSPDSEWGRSGRGDGPGRDGHGWSELR